MSETDAGREPVQILEIEFPRCANEYGCGACTAGQGAVTASDLTQDFARDGLGSYSGTNATTTRVPGGILVEPTTADPQFLVGSATTGFNGSNFRYVTVCLTARADMDLSGSNTKIFYTDTAFTFTSGSSMTAINANLPFRGRKDLSNVKAGDRITLVFDAADSPDYATDWDGTTVVGMRFDIGNDATYDFEIHSIAISNASLYDARGSECFKTRATCQEINSYRARPWANEDPDTTYNLREATIEVADLDTASDVFFACDVSFTNDPSGTVFAVGSASNFAYLGITGTDLVFAAGGNAASDQARVAVPASTVAGRSLTVICEIDFTNDSATLWLFDGTSRELTKAGTDSPGSSFPAAWAAATDGQVAGDGGTTYGSEDGGDFDGLVRVVRYYGERYFTGTEEEVYKLDIFFGRKEQNRPADDIRILPMLEGVSTVGTRINIGASDPNYDPIGGRAILEFAMEDAPMTDRGIDPYYSDRGYTVESGDRGLFWERMRVREKFGKLGALVRVYEGYTGQKLVSMKKRLYLLDQLDLPARQNVRFRARDILSRAELRKAQVPAASNGVLLSDIDTLATTFDTTGHDLTDYPQSGTVRINDECIQYTAITDLGEGEYRFTVAGSGRGTDGTDVDDHSEGDTVQLCRRYTEARIDDILTELLGQDAGIEYQYLAISNWDSEEETYLSAYTLSTLITEPTAVSKLVGELAEQCTFYIWWDERSQVIDMEAIRALDAFPDVLSDMTTFVEDSVRFREKPEERISQLWFYFNQSDRTQKLDDIQNYRSLYIDANLAAESDEQYGQAAIRSIFSRWISVEAQATQTASRLAVRYQDVPLEMTFETDAKDRDLWVGDRFRADNFRLRTELGAIDFDRIFTITSAKEVIPGELMRYTAEDTTLSGFIYKITSNSQGDHTGEFEVDDFYAFITDNDGFQSDGTQGTRIT